MSSAHLQVAFGYFITARPGKLDLDIKKEKAKGTAEQKDQQEKLRRMNRTHKNQNSNKEVHLMEVITNNVAIGSWTQMWNMSEKHNWNAQRKDISG